MSRYLPDKCEEQVCSVKDISVVYVTKDTSIRALDILCVMVELSAWIELWFRGQTGLSD